MKSKQAAPSLGLLTVFFVLCIAFASVSCGTLKNEFSSPAGTTNPPPITSQLNQMAPVAATAIPAPWGQIVAAVMSLAASGAAAFATFHARSAAATAKETAQTLTAPPPNT